jgi:hypothetical protein
MSQSRNSKKIEWTNKIDQWKMSGKKAQTWCRENHVVYSTFSSWRKRLEIFQSSKANQQLSSTPQFLELHDQQIIKSEISLEYAGVLIHFKGEFDPNLLKKCLAILRGTSC